MDFSWLASIKGNFTWKFPLEQKVNLQRLTFDEMVGVKRCSGVYSQMIQNNDKQFSTGTHNRKTLRKVTAIF